MDHFEAEVVYVIMVARSTIPFSFLALPAMLAGLLPTRASECVRIE